jgi:hypothetical protein
VYVDRWAPSFASEIAAIQAEFEAGAPTVKLLKDTAFEATDEPLIILDGKTLDLNGWTLSDDEAGNILVVQGDVTDSTTDKKGKVDFTNGDSYILASETFYNTNISIPAAGSIAQVADIGSASVVNANTNLGAVVSFTGSSLPAETDSRYAALANGSTGIILFSPTLTTPLVVGDNPLYVIGDLKLSHIGTIANVGTVVVSKAVTSSATDAGTKVVSGELKAKSLISAGGEFVGTVTLTDPNALAAANVFTGKFAKLTVPGVATLNDKVEFLVDSTISGLVTVSDKTTLKGALTVAGGNISEKLTIVSGTLTTSAGVNLSGENGVIVLDSKGLFWTETNGKLTAGNYELTGAGSVANYVANVGTLITLAGNGISAGTSQGETPLSLVFGGATGPTLNFKNDTTITGVALDVSKGGSLTLASSKKLTITGGNDDDNMAGSIVAGGDAENIAGTLGGGVLIIAASSITAAGGEGYLIGGTADQASVAAGSIGTVAYYIAKGAEFVEINPEGGSTAVWAQGISSEYAATAKLGGSIAVFTK